MRFARWRKNLLVFAFLPEQKPLKPISEALRAAKFFRSATIKVSAKDDSISAGWIASKLLSYPLIAACAILAAILGRLTLAYVTPLERWTESICATLAGAVGGWALMRILDIGFAKRILHFHRRWVLSGETMVAISTSPARATEAATLLAAVVGEHSSVFVLTPRELGLSNPVARDQPILAEEEVRVRAIKLASEVKNATVDRSSHQTLLPRLKECKDVMTRVEVRLARAVSLEQSVALSAEWILDNSYIVRGHIEDFRRNLPASFYRELPQLRSEKWKGHPRIYAIACEMVSDWDGAFSRHGIESFLQTFQSETPLTTAELWAIPMMVRLRLIEVLATLGVEIELRQSESEQAAFWANRLLFTGRREPDRMPEMLAAIAADCPRPSPHMVEQLLDQLYDEDSALAPVRAWLQSKFSSPLEEVVRHHAQVQAADQASLANAISSLRLFSQLDWREVFESVSHVEAILWTDPAFIYGGMDFETRDRYRHSVERISRRAKASEESVAEAAITLARESDSDPMRHVGFFLIDDGTSLLEQRLQTRAAFNDLARRWTKRHAALVYISGVAVGAIALDGLAVVWSRALSESAWAAFVLAILFALPATDLAVQLFNYLATRILKPYALPKMTFGDGIPDEFRTLVVVPMMLLTADSIRDEIERLEIRALANPDPNLRFALLSDYSDAPQQQMPEDLELLDIARHGIEQLNASHGDQRFLLFARNRQWSDSEQCWMGWERKRGKLEELNQVLVDGFSGQDEVVLQAGSIEQAVGIQLVITLDSDTQLPRDSAKRMVATLAHPLNRPILTSDGRHIQRGYSIIQPRVSTSLPSATASLFSLIFTDSAGIDPYTHAVSDVYQDLSGYGSYHGKGIYDLHAFHRVMSNRFPRAHLLSHDLLEGAYACVGLASDIELLDLFPNNYGSYCSRQQRWIRGDWQIADWLLPTIPTAQGGREPNRLPPLERWKIFDNLRRSLTPIAVLAMLIFGSVIAPNGAICAWLVLALLMTSIVFPLVTRLTQKWLVDPMVWQEPAMNFSRSLLLTAALPHQAWISVSAICQVVYRRTISHRLLLEWVTGRPSGGGSRLARVRQLLIRMSWSPVFAVAATVFVLDSQPSEADIFLPFAVLWAISPVVLAWMDRPFNLSPAKTLSADDRAELRLLARRTWRFFDEFVSEKTNFLPPDNYQEMLRSELAERTSPTNIGLYLASIMAAYDFGFESADQSIERYSATVETLKKLERFRGHFYNWYETSTLAPLGEKYVSTVDSGNLMGAFWAAVRGLEELGDMPILDRRVFLGLRDCLALVAANNPGAAAKNNMTALALALRETPDRLEDIIHSIRSLAPLTAALVQSIPDGGVELNEARYWAKKLQLQVQSWNDLIQRYCPWFDLLATPPSSGILSLGPDSYALHRASLTNVPTLTSLSKGFLPGLTDLLLISPVANVPSSEAAAWLEGLRAEFEKSRQAAEAGVARINGAIAAIEEFDREMGMGFLYDGERRLFAIGYNVAEQRLDQSYYDLLASEARLGSFLAIARGDVPTEHWWALGRPFGFAYLRRPLLSWSGTMFEYLMPLLFTRRYANSLLDQACRVAVACQIAFAAKRKIPWGISESAYSALDARLIYQYRAFGVPGLALKRGLEEDLVVSPYSSALALAVNPKVAMKNLQNSGPLAKAGLLGGYGFYDSIDFTRRDEPGAEKGLLVYTYMAHHQGMALLAMDNAVCGEPNQTRFHNDPRVRATASLLYERVPVAPPLVKSYSRESGATRPPPIFSVAPPGRVETADTTTPRTCLLSNGNYHSMVTNAGGGYSKWKNFDITRWRADTTEDAYGKFIYFRDLDTGLIWSSSHQPIREQASSYSASFSAEKAEIRRRDRGVETLTEIVVSPEDDAEIWRLTLINRSPRTKRIEVTTYAELALAPHATDRTHQAFNKLFIETAMIRDLDALLAWRRLRSPSDAPIWVGQVMASTSRSHDPTQFETDRARFLGRGRTPLDPIAITEVLSGSEGYVLDPIFSLRRTLTIPSGESVQFSLVTVASDNHDTTVALAAKYRDPEATRRAFNLAWTQSQLELRHLRIKPSDVQVYQQLAGHLLYPHSQMRAPGDRIARNSLGQRSLWAHGISGDLPIAVLLVDDEQQIDVVDEVLVAHNFLRSRGLMFDLVILNQEAASYEQPVQVQLQRLIASRSGPTGIDQPGGVFLRPARQMDPQDLTLIFASAHVVLVAARGPLPQQIGVPPKLIVRTSSSPKRSKVVEEPSTVLPFLELAEHNGIGGFNQDGSEYAIYLGAGQTTPRPWSNTFANPNFGALITDEGSGFTWFGNSQSNRLTPWSNDPISNPAGEAIYISDYELNWTWTPTPIPIRENDPYRTRHGLGYSVSEHSSHAIKQELTTFVPCNDAGGLPVRIQRLKLTNQSSQRRTLTLTLYVEWTLGADRELTQQNIVTNWDLESKSLFARNAFSQGYSDVIAFAACSLEPEAFSGDRTEIIGRNGQMADPAGLRTKGLSGRCGGGLDPCAAIQTTVTFDPQESIEVSFIIGAARSPDAIRETLRTLRKSGAVAATLEETRLYWRNALGAIEIDTPEPAANIMVNHWLPYQTLSCRFLGRSGFYQSGGAFGFRDQLQDVLGLIYTLPHLVHDHILRSAARQFVEGDVQHWWHADSGAGVRTRISDDLLWLPFVTAHYVKVTGDVGILDEQVPFIEGRALEAGEHDAYFVPTVSAQSGTLWEHCKRAIERGATSGPHSLPLIGGGDWNDGLDLVGAAGKGESVWLAWFLIQTIRDFADVSTGPNEVAANDLRARANELAKNIDANCWDGDWYVRAFYDDGTPLGSKDSDEAKIDSLSQSWAAITGAGDDQRAIAAMNSVNKMLVKKDPGIVLLFDPPFDSSSQQPGYIKGYPPGVRENGGQYTHGSLWSALAWARLKDGDKAVELLLMMNPVRLASNPETYLVEPYAVAADVYALPGRTGMGGWTWYTGSSSWMYRIWVEEVLGLKMRGDRMSLEPVIPSDWPGFSMKVRYGKKTFYEIAVTNNGEISDGKTQLTHNGKAAKEGWVPLIDDGKPHKVNVVLPKIRPPALATKSASKSEKE